MRRHRQFRRSGIILAAVIAGLLLASTFLFAACAGGEEATEEETAASVVEMGEGQPKQVILAEKAVERIGIETVAIRQVSDLAAAATTPAFGGEKTLVPYSAVLYDAEGNTWTFVNTEGQTFIRKPIAIDQIQGDVAILSSGPPVGTLVVSVGAAELLGTEVGVTHE
jgi:hypothetical protein